jgi:hypothetical protein
MEEGTDPLPKCDLFRKHVRPNVLQQHGLTKECKDRQKLLRWRTAVQEAHDTKELWYTIGDAVLESVDQFCYLGRPMLANDDDIGAIQHNITKARRKWQMLSQILSREGAKPKVIGIFYRAVIQLVLLYGSETWVLTKEKYQLSTIQTGNCSAQLEETSPNSFSRCPSASDQWNPRRIRG